MRVLRIKKLTMYYAVRRGYHYKAGSYLYVNCPAISRGEWHPFSLIPVPGTDSRAAFYAEAVRLYFLQYITSLY